MNTTLKKGLIRGLGIAVGGGFAIGLLAGGTGVANASPSSNAYTDPSGAAATCATAAEGFTGNIAHDGTVALGIAKGISGYYGVSMVEAIHVENYQVQTYCPQYWPNLVAIGAYARAHDGTGSSDV